MSARRDERGSAAIFVIGMSLVLIVCAGLVVDGGLGINARMRVADDAEQAARVAADSIDVDLLRSGGGLVINEQLARQRAASYLGRRGYGAGQYAIDVDGNQVDVEVRDTTETTLLKLINVDSYDVRATASSVPQTEAD
ncbi:MAG: pilus assembly protein TadE [Aeromicrobium sp.]|jgi:Flp pilus assembly protein TadG|uniref:TadE/TadG family type IV pilus assembly protein n=1 Tax=Aeromicrobium sp. TaxID=1871063 RepID=UPI00260EBA9A|nr:pilus assembly protein TadG-related protein [Aeromicrobium sp.]MCW2790385.1 pilus assembly protein TadE [Aeromicrobium sp.]MCW2824436.1 pilus assembly protein TadE [Aeromicrobium sp.]